MRKQFGKVLCGFGAAAFALQLLGSSALAVDTMADWTGLNTVMPEFAPDNNYGLISNTSAGGQLQSKINFSGFQPEGQPLDQHFVYLSDPTLEGPTLDFTTPLHMEGTITFNSPQATEPNILFGWYNSEDTRHRIGLGISNRSVSQGGAIANSLRIDFGYASTSYPNPNPPPDNLGNKFYYVSTDGNQPADSVNSVIPNGTYPFTFDFTPGPVGEGMVGGSMSATVGDFFKTVQPLETEPEDHDFFTFDRFGIVQRSTTNVTQLGFYDVVFSNVTYTGGTALPQQGDFDGDGDVDGADFVVWQTNFPKETGGTLDTGDADGDGDVDGADFVVWQTNFPFTPSPGVAPVPEPTSMCLLALGGLIALAQRKLRRA